jgi:hypothetical protein
VETGCDRVAGLARRSLDDRIDLVDHSMTVVVVVVRARCGHMAAPVRIHPLRRRLALGSALANLVCSRLVAHKASHMVRDLYVDCGVARHPRAALSRNPGYSRTRPLSAI